ncbi:MAG: L-ribulose-5-phosphate 4-epimerase [Kiritimatiellae bacterium]|nr:L-ribulose-5-phosphate 4-epimerase [Kiritimatiellia bacterium]MDD5523016.1 L-ribulose-5-phosphate 4-epimerase [Kiritimatiellia bacterium]
MSLDKLKRHVCEANKALERNGLITLTWGNVSGIDRSKNLVVIKPSGVTYADLKPSDMVVLDLSSGKKIGGKYRPSSDAPTHLILYRAFPDIGGITHAHSIYASMFAQACISIPALGTTHADIFHGEVPITRPLTKREVEDGYEVNTGKVIVERFKKLDTVAVPGVLVANHGPFTWGQSAQDSVHNSIALEAVAKMAYGTLIINPKVKPLPDYLLDKHFFRKHGPNAYYGQKKNQ